MVNAWTEHVKQYRSQHPDKSYKQCLQDAKATYNKTEGSGVKEVVRKVKNTVKRVRKTAKRASNAVDKHADFINLIAGDDVGKAVNKVNNTYKNVEAEMGAGIDMKKVMKKTRKVVKKARRIAKTVAPAVALAGHPEIALGLETIGAGSENRYIKAIEGSGCGCKKGGSFAVPRVGGSYQNTQSSILNPQHPGFAPLKPKPVSRRQKEN